MIAKLTVFKETYGSWAANTKRAAGESWDLLCLDVSEPPAHRMEEMLYYRLKPDEKEKWWGKTVGKSLVVAIHKIRQGENGGKAVIQGMILDDEVKPAIASK